MNEIKFTAGFIKRMNAHALDLSLMVSTMFLIFLMTFGFESRVLIRVTLFILIFYTYEILIPILNQGQTFGKKMMKLKPLSSQTNQPLTVKQLHIRTFIKYGLLLFSYGITHLVSFFMISERQDRCAIHDLIVKTYVTDLSQESTFYEVDEFAKHLGA